MLFKIINLRAYAKAKATYDQGQLETDPMKRPRGGMIEVVRDMAFSAAREKINAAIQADLENQK